MSETSVNGTAPPGGETGQQACTDATRFQAEMAQKLWDAVSLLVLANRVAGNARAITGLTREQVGVLMALRHGPQQMGRLAAMCLITPGAATRLVDRLVTKGLIAREGVPESHRAVLVSVTPEGKRLQAVVMDRIRQRYARSVGVLSLEQMEALAPILDTILAKLPQLLNEETAAGRLSG